MKIPWLKVIKWAFDKELKIEFLTENREFPGIGITWLKDGKSWGCYVPVEIKSENNFTNNHYLKNIFLHILQQISYTDKSFEELLKEES